MVEWCLFPLLFPFGVDGWKDAERERPEPECKSPKFSPPRSNVSQNFCLWLFKVVLFFRGRVGGLLEVKDIYA